jgi:ADP-heptose:LPS heptosyltransferase
VKNILVLKLGALGNIVLSLGAFAAIRQHHPDAQITLLTTRPYAGWMAGAPWFDRVLIDTRPAWWDLSGVLRLRRMLREGHFGRVYDLQTSGRSSHYFRLFPRGAQPEWSGIAPGCSHPDRNPDRDRLHDVDRLRSQLRQAGIPDMPPADLSWCRGDISRFGLPRPFALLVPGSSPHRLVKRWPAEHYRALAAWLTRQGIAPVVIGIAGERMLSDRICAGTAITQGAGARDLTGQTGFGDLAGLGRAATMAIGNDTGPMHLLAAAGCPSLVLFSGDSDPARCAPVAPPGAPGVRVLRRDDLATLTPEEVTAEALNLVQATAPVSAKAPA